MATPETPDHVDAAASLVEILLPVLRTSRLLPPKQLARALCKLLRLAALASPSSGTALADALYPRLIAMDEQYGQGRAVAAFIDACAILAYRFDVRGSNGR